MAHPATQPPSPRRQGAPLPASSRPRAALLLAGPPGSSSLWDGVAARLGEALEIHRLELFDPLPADPSVLGLARRVADALVALRQPALLVAHGSAVPVALRAAPLAQPAGLVISNGPVHRLDPFLWALSRAGRAPALLAGTLLQPAVLRGWLASSLGLRRAVINPYVMDRDTVVALLDPLLQSPPHRIALARFLASLAEATNQCPIWDGPALVVWGDADPLYPAFHGDEARRFLPKAQVVAVPGGQHLHPVERPWALADAVAMWVQEGLTAT